MGFGSKIKSIAKKTGIGSAVGSMTGMGPFGSILGGAAGALGGMGGGYDTTSQQVMETPEQREARRMLLQYAQTGNFGNIKAGEDIGIQSGNYDMSGLENTATGQLYNRLNAGNPEMFGLADQGIRDLMDTSAAGLDAQFSPYKALAEREGRNAADALKRNAAFSGSLYGSDTIRGLGDVAARTAETNQARLADLTTGALNRKTQAIGLAQQSGSLSEDTARNRIADAFQYGGLQRNLQNAQVEAANAEKMRRRNEQLNQINAGMGVAGQNAQFGVPEIKTPKPNPYMDFLNLIVGTGGSVAGSIIGAKAGRA